MFTKVLNLQKKILDEVLEAKNFRTYMRIGPRAMRYVPMNEGSKEAKRLAREWKWAGSCCTMI